MPRATRAARSTKVPKATGAAKPSGTVGAAKASKAGVVAGGSRLTFVTGNAGKVAELAAQVAGLGYDVVQDKRGYPEIQADTLGEVCAAGAQHLLAAGLKPPFLLEDSGLFVSALKGFPGVYSRNALDTIGCAGILRLLRDTELELRSAAFRTHLLYVDASGTLHGFDGACKGRITERPAGGGGFGFDPIFAPDGGDGATFAEMDVAAKNQLSHRGQAVRAFLAYLAKSAKT